MSSSGLSAEDSSDDEEFSPSKKDNTKADTPKRTIEAEGSSSDDDGKADEQEENEEEPKKTSAAGLFGEDSDDSDDSDGGPRTEPSPKKSKQSNSGLFGDDSEDDDEGEAKLDDVVGSAAPVSSVKGESADIHDDDAQRDVRGGNMTVPMPPEKATVLESTRLDDHLTVHMTKLPNLVAIQPAAFEESLFIEKEEEEQYKGYVQNMIRWRYKRNADGELERDDDDQLIRESNSRIVQWSDGSFTLHIGNEVFDVQTTDSSSGGFAGLNGYVYLSQKATFSGEGTEEETAGGTVLECMAPVTSRFVPKPSSLQSEAHKSLTVAVRQRTIKKALIAEHVTFEDPEKAKAARIRNKEDMDRATARNQNNRSGGSRYRRPDMSRRYLEEDEDDANYDTTNIRALKKGNRDDEMDDYGDDSDDDGLNDTYIKGRKRSRTKDESDEEELGLDDDSDDEQGGLVKAHSSSKRKTQAFVDDDDDDDDDD